MFQDQDMPAGGEEKPEEGKGGGEEKPMGEEKPAEGGETPAAE